MATKEQKLKLLRSDLSDLSNDKILKKYPHLDSDTRRRQLREEIAKLEVED